MAWFCVSHEPCNRGADHDADKEVSHLVSHRAQCAPILGLARLLAAQVEDLLRAFQLCQVLLQAKLSLNPDGGPIWLVLFAHFAFRLTLSPSVSLL